MANKYTFDIDKACTWAKLNATAKSRHICATNVKQAMQAGGLPYVGGYNGCDMDRYCNMYGFQQVQLNMGNGQRSPTNAQKGDIACIKHGQYGHTCIYDGCRWISDFLQNTCVPYSSGWGGVTFWRWTDNPAFSGYDPNIQAVSYSDDWVTSNGGYSATNSYTSFTGNGGNIFSTAEENSFQIASLNRNIDVSSNTVNRTRIYSTNDATIVLDELSLPLTDSSQNTSSNT